MEKVQLFLDYENTNEGAKKIGCELDYGVLLNEHLVVPEEGRFLVDSFAYVAVDPRQEHKSDLDIQTLWESDYFVNTKVGTIQGNTFNCDFNVEITMDIMKIVHQSKPDIILIVTGSPDFIPLVKELRKMGIRVEIASFEETVSKELSLVASGFIDLNFYLEEDDEGENFENDAQSDESVVEEVQTNNLTENNLKG